MRIIAHRSLVAFYTKHADAKQALEIWYDIAKYAGWCNFADIRRDFNSADSIGNQRFVFNIKGNNYRIVAVVKFRIKMIYIRFVGTHEQYDKTDVKNV